MNKLDFRNVGGKDTRKSLTLLEKKMSEVDKDQNEKLKNLETRMGESESELKELINDTNINFTSNEKNLAEYINMNQEDLNKIQKEDVVLHERIDGLSVNMENFKKTGEMKLQDLCGEVKRVDECHCSKSVELEKQLQDLSNETLLRSDTHSSELKDLKESISSLHVKMSSLQGNMEELKVRERQWVDRMTACEKQQVEIYRVVVKYFESSLSNTPNGDDEE